MTMQPIPELDLPTFLLAGSARHGGRPAFVDGRTGRAVRYDELAPAAGRIAAGLAARGFRKGDVLAVLAPNVPEWPLALLGALTAGGAVNGINPLWTTGEIAAQLTDSGARFVLTVPPFLDRAREAAGDARIVLAGGEAPGTIPFAALLAETAPLRPVAISPADTALLPYSSGTTGLPKGVRLTHRNIVANVLQGEAWTAATPHDVVLAALPYFHAAGSFSGIFLALHGGATVVTQPRFDLEECLALIQEHRGTILPAAPPIVLALARHPAVDRYDLSSLELVVSGSAPLPAAVQRDCAARLGRRVVQAYGMTETSTLIAMGRRDPAAPHADGSVGEPVPGTEIRLVDPHSGAEAAEVGELWVRGPQVMAGYLRDEAATAEMIDADGWLRTGDLATLSATGEIVILDRVKELIKVGGFQVPPAELEALLVTHPAVADAAVLGRPDPDRGEVPVAFVAPRGELDPDAVAAFVAERVAGYKRIAEVRIVDVVPRSPAGKILRRALRHAVAAPA
ncbi:AMP-binding protein [Pseudonocardia asaccharolytica]|uniref:AMP-dependent synthetase n=1 Tax=Pseudonocardia asaccharolytica DSM 44247 = NBRC 16224 TaxID=1123024 RepID=A0A511D2U1_9PSEU|nr:AMP-binding protein [Pseudonocardia asaccharolytica]GEL19090.1 AMP-dependent synthetase [Pseudonocardia asaccharolytica DSM 44247 = NBRC 16224]